MKNKSSFLLNFFSLNAVSLLIKLLNFIFFIFLVRELPITEYGIYALVWAQVSFFTPLLDFGTTSYGLVYLEGDKKREMNSLLSFRLAIALIIFFVTVASAILYVKELPIPLYVFLTSFAVFGNVMYGSFVILMSLRQKAYLSSLFSLVFTVLLVSVSSFALFATKSLFFVFVVIFVMYNVNALVSFLIVRRVQNGFRFTFVPALWKEIVSKSYVFVLISFFLGIYFKIDVFLLKILKSETEVGIYSAGYKFFESMLFIIGSYNIAATPRLAQMFREKSSLFVKRIHRDGWLLFSLGTLIAIVTFLVAPLLLSLILKQSSAESARVLQIVIFALPLMLLSTVFTNALYIYSRAKIIILVYSVQIIVNIILNLLFVPHFSYIASAYITVFNELVNVLVLFTLFQYYKHHENKR